MLGERIGLMRRRMGWSQAELAKRLQVSPSAVGMYEQGRREPSLAGMVTMSRIFGVSVDFLLTGKPMTPQDGQALRQAVERNMAGFEQNRAGLTKEELAVLFTAVLTEA